MNSYPARTPRRILMTADTVGGVWTYALELARALETEEVEITLATMGARLSRGQIREANSIPNLEICSSHYKLEWMPNPWREVTAAGEWLVELAESRRPDVIHLNEYAHGALPWPAPVLMVAHSCVLSWWRAVKGYEAPPEYDRYREAVASGIRAADFLVAPSRAMLDSFRQCHGPLPPAEVIPNGRQPELFQPGEKKDRIFTAGRLWDEAKNVAAVAAAAQDLPWPVYVAGESRSPEGRRFKRRHIHPLGQLPADELAGWLSESSIFALPAYYEPFGLCALEAGLAGCALVLGDIPSLREIWGDAAVFVPPDDRPALKAAFERLIGNRALLNRMGARALMRATEFSPRKMARRYLSVYARLMEKSRKPKEPIPCVS